MPIYTLGQAAKAVGKSKMTISRAIGSGKLSASRNTDGTYAIDASELARVWAPVSADTVTSAAPVSVPATPTVTAGETAALRRENVLLREMVERERMATRDLEAKVDRLLGLVETRLIEPPRRRWWRR